MFSEEKENNPLSFSGHNSFQIKNKDPVSRKIIEISYKLYPVLERAGPVKIEPCLAPFVVSNGYCGLFADRQSIVFKSG